MNSTTFNNELKFFGIAIMDKYLTLINFTLVSHVMIQNDMESLMIEKSSCLYHRLFAKTTLN